MAIILTPNEVNKPALVDQFANLEAKSRSEFDDNGWSAFTDKINEYVNDLYVGTRRECITRCNNDVTLKYDALAKT